MFYDLCFRSYIPDLSFCLSTLSDWLWARTCKPNEPFASLPQQKLNLNKMSDHVFLQEWYMNSQQVYEENAH